MYTKQILPIRAKKDIVCYKVLEKRKDFGYRTPYYKMVCHLGTTVQALPLTTKLPESCWRIVGNKIGKGFIHAYIELGDARVLRFNLRMEEGEDFVVVKCIIPQGTLYYKGCFAYRHIVCVAAKEIKLLEIIES